MRESKKLMKTIQTNRIDYIDALRVVACLAVVFLHVAASGTYSVDFKSPSWNLFAVYETMVNWAVPVFAMISGAVMLRKDYSYQMIFKKIGKVLIIFLIWSILYTVFDIAVMGSTSYLDDFLWLRVVIQGHYHMWYLIMLCGLYLVTPIIKAIADKTELTKAFVVLAIIFTVVYPSIINLFQIKAVGHVLENHFLDAVYMALYSVVNDLNFHMTLGFVSYFVIGYYIAENDHICCKKGLIISALAIAFGTALLLFEIENVESKESANVFLQHYQLGIFLQSCGIMVLVKKLSGTNLIKCIAKISPLTLGIYMIHPLLIESLQRIGVTTIKYNGWLSVPLLAVAIFFVSCVVIAICLHTPLKKFVSL